MNKVEMILGKSILRPLKPIKVSKKISVPDDEKNKDLKPGEVRENKFVKQKVYAGFQLAEVVATSDNNKLFSIGETVVFRPGREVEFDLIKDVVLVMDFDVVGKWVEVVEESLQ